MRELILIDRRRRLEKLLDKIETTYTPPHLVGSRTKSLIKMYVDYLRAEDPEWPNSKITYADVIQSLNDHKLLTYIHAPVQKRVHEAREALRKGNIKAVDKLLKKLESVEEGEIIKSEIQTIYRSKRGRHEGFNQLIDQIYRENSSIKTPQLLQRLRKEVGKGLIVSIKDDHNEINLSDGTTFSISGLKDQLSKRRKKLKI
jgi:hypothetical protein